MGHGAWRIGHGTRGQGDRGTREISNAQCPMPNAQCPFLEKFFQPPKQLLEKSDMSPTIEIAETNVSVHSSHHTPPGLLFGRFLMFINKF
ncbi:hypothetical protein LC574_09305 [Nostoc sp. CHAB 5715]|nr:hypothetical protein [Nostoc sp. CHAB 5715]